MLRRAAEPLVATMEFDLSIRAPPQTLALPEERPGIAALASIAAEASSIQGQLSDRESEDELREELKDDEWRIATGKRGRDTPSPDLDPALKMLRGAIDQMPPGSTDLFGDPVFDLPPLPRAHSEDFAEDSFAASTADCFENPLASGAGSSKSHAGLLRDEGGIKGFMETHRPRKGKEKAKC